MATKGARPAKPRRTPRREPCPDTPDPVDLAMEFAASDQPMPEVARRVLEEHAQLIRAQRDELRLRKVGEGVRAALWAILAIIAFAILTMIAALIVRAARSDSLIVESFDVPPSLEARGMTGKVVATQVLDRLAEMQKQTVSIRAASTYANNWEDDLSIDIPNTRTTTDQIWKLLRGWLGKETRISGEVVDTGEGLAFTARVGANPGRRFVSDNRDLDSLVTQGAELIYEQTQPYRYSVFIGRDPKRWAEGNTILHRLSRDPSPVERKWAFNGLAANARRDGKFHAAIAYARRMMAIDKDMLPAYTNLAQAYGALGHEQPMVDTLRRAAGLGLGREFDPDVAGTLMCASTGLAALAIPDPKALLETANCASTVSTPAGAQQEVIFHAHYAQFRHAPWFHVTVPPLPDDSPVETRFRTAIMRLRAELAGGSRDSLSNALNEFNSGLAERMKDVAEGAAVRASYPVTGRSLQARALALLGRYSEAEATIRPSPLGCYECLRVRGLVAEGLGQPNEAQQWYSKAVHEAPRIARAYVDWARLLAKHRRFEGAERRFAKAAKLAPNWADPLKYWGDALAAQGKRQEALDKYAAASKLAPRWAELKAAQARLSA